ncbi:hypothetical protein PROFUN_14596 [Planoprotostelium fungivorum]|uniref:Uncharacterized protein n=1 Tax=Planoprotostelium fungivorum TaxID=1890364 RepID=A0A2P6MZG8_9EUKA|nr:hypothetical protein PROFUN_14596 [Planoprotostelium fungivorum]
MSYEESFHLQGLLKRRLERNILDIEDLTENLPSTAQAKNVVHMDPVGLSVYHALKKRQLFIARTGDYTKELQQKLLERVGETYLLVPVRATFARYILHHLNGQIIQASVISSRLLPDLTLSPEVAIVLAAEAWTQSVVKFTSMRQPKHPEDLTIYNEQNALYGLIENLETITGKSERRGRSALCMVVVVRLMTIRRLTQDIFISSNSNQRTPWLDEELSLLKSFDSIRGASALSKKNVTTKDPPSPRVRGASLYPSEGADVLIQLRPNLRVLVTSSGSKAKRVAGTISIPGLKKGDIPSKGIQKPMANQPINTSKEGGPSKNKPTSKDKLLKRATPPAPQCEDSFHVYSLTSALNIPVQLPLQLRPATITMITHDPGDITASPVDELNPTSFHHCSDSISTEAYARALKLFHLRKPVLVTEVPETKGPWYIIVQSTGVRTYQSRAFKPKYERGTYEITDNFIVMVSNVDDSLGWTDSQEDETGATRLV